LTFDATDDVAAPFIASGVRPKMAMLREQGVNSHVEMSYAMAPGRLRHLRRAHVRPAGRPRAARAVPGLVACGGFSYGDTLGAGEGWARSHPLQPAAGRCLRRLLQPADTLALGVCNGCQMMAALSPLIPGTQAWPRFTRNRSQQFEARLSMVEVLESPSLFFAGMAGSRLPIAVAHGEGLCRLQPAWRRRHGCSARCAFVDHHGQATEAYPFNPNGSPGGLTAVTTADGRFTALMPHPERVFRNVQMSWSGGDIDAHSPWLRMFRNARRALG
jgi:phosphoribosylformylglycinamidine synthase